MVLGGFRSFHVSVLAQNGFNCRKKKKKQCPLDNNCLINSVICKANVTTDKDNIGKNYIALTEGTFKDLQTTIYATLTIVPQQKLC